MKDNTSGTALRVRDQGEGQEGAEGAPSGAQGHCRDPQDADGIGERQTHPSERLSGLRLELPVHPDVEHGGMMGHGSACFPENVSHMRDKGYPFAGVPLGVT